MANASIHHELNQQQTLTPQMRRSLEILQANNMELSQLIHQAMELNPLLEPADEIADEEIRDENDQTDDDQDFSYLNETDDDDRDREIYQSASVTHSADSEEYRQFLYESIVAPETLQQFLAQQVQQSIMPEEIKNITMILIGYLNERGFLEASPDELAQRLEINPRWMKQAVTLLQSFAPSGIGALDLRDSLLIQLRRLGKKNSLEYTICDQYLHDLARRHIAQIARSLETTPALVMEAGERIAKLDPAPGGSFQPTANPHITPDVIIRRTRDGDFEAELTNDHIPRLKISDFYKSLLAKTGSDKKTLEYLRDNLRDGRSIISSLSLRQETIYAIAQRIIARQKPFLQGGHSKLRPMKMTEIGEELGMHYTTISRAVAGKYILTPHGMMEMRAFFAPGFQTSCGAEFSNSAVRDAIQTLIQGENPAKPLSDEAITKTLNQSGIEIKRRTVAKYREQLHILPTYLRKRE